MKIVDAYWDTRSLGCKCGEIDFDGNESTDEIVEALNSASVFDYLVIKIPVNHLEIQEIVQNKDFHFCESSFEITMKLSEARSTRMIDRISKDIHLERANSTTKLKIYEEILKGTFETDRISLDPAFGKKIAAKRYINWIEDELKKSGSLYHIFYKDEEVGFFSYKETIPGIEAWAFLAGIYEEFKTSGLGVSFLLDSTRKYALSRNCKRIRTFVSSNNLPILRAHIAYGFNIKSIKNVFTKHF